MSLILEALRKSEAERQRGRAPGLFVAQTKLPAPTRRAPAWAWALGALLVAVLAAWGLREWQRSTESSRTPATPHVVVAAPAAPPADAGPADVEMADAGAAAIAAAEPARAPEASRQTPSPSTARGEAEPAPAVVPAPTAVPDAVASEPTRLPAPAAVEAPLPSLSQLPAGERAQLPALKLSMHVYADDPAQRFVILDGQRLGEGASPVSGVVLEQIRRDGLVLSVNGQRLLLARP